MDLNKENSQPKLTWTILMNLHQNIDLQLKEYYKIVNEARPLSGFVPTDAVFFTEMHF